jgi:hypothetical protein
VVEGRKKAGSDETVEEDGLGYVDVVGILETHVIRIVHCAWFAIMDISCRMAFAVQSTDAIGRRAVVAHCDTGNHRGGETRVMNGIGRIGSAVTNVGVIGDTKVLAFFSRKLVVNAPIFQQQTIRTGAVLQPGADAALLVAICKIIGKS